MIEILKEAQKKKLWILDLYTSSDISVSIRACMVQNKTPYNNCSFTDVNAAEMGHISLSTK